MTTGPPTRDLFQLAELFGAQPVFEDVNGKTHEASPESLTHVLRALGAPINTEGDAASAVREEQDRLARQTLAPVIACSFGNCSVKISLPRGKKVEECWATMVLEGGLVTRLRPALIPVSIGPSSFVTYLLALDRAFGAPIPLGYHELHIEAPGVSATALVVVAPKCPVPARGWGVFQPLHALRGASDWGVGSYRDLAELTEWIEELGGDFVGTLPLYPTYLESYVEVSPYLPVTRLGWSELFIDPALVPELMEAPAAKSLMESHGLMDSTGAQAATAVDYPDVMARIRRVLEPMAESLFASVGDRRRELEEFSSSHPELVRYAQFRASREVGSAVAGATSDIQSLGERARYHLYVQWVAAQQIAAAGERLYLDMPIGVHPEGFDPWWKPHTFAEDVEGGAPPDAFFSSGQTWGFRPLHPRAMVEDGFQYTIACLRHVMARASVIRIDHVMGLQRLFWVPAGSDATHGVYVRYPLEEMKSIVALEAHRSGTSVVGEDLGTVPKEVTAAMEDSNMLRTWVMQFAVKPRDPLPAPTELAMASLGTHDLPRFASFLDGDDIDDLVERGAQDESWAEPERNGRRAWRRSLDELCNVGAADRLSVSPADEFQLAVRHLASSRARLVSLDLEDIWQERRPVNRPGSGAEAKNWQARSSLSLQEMKNDRAVNATLSSINAARRVLSPAVRSVAAERTIVDSDEKGAPNL